jgi:hypothetical protein
MTTIVTRIARPSVRWPFRILAAALCLLVIAAAALSIFAWWAGKLRAIDTRAIVWAPGMLWFTRHAYYAARYGRSAPSPSWPFASESVANWYFLLVLIGMLV